MKSHIQYMPPYTTGKVIRSREGNFEKRDAKQRQVGHMGSEMLLFIASAFQEKRAML